MGYASCKPADALVVFCLLFCLFVCTVTDFSVAEKDRGVKFCVHVGLLSRQVFSHFGGQRSKIKVTRDKNARLALPRSGRDKQQEDPSRDYRRVRHIIRGHLRRGSVGSRSWGRRRCLRPYGGSCVLQACRRACFICVQKVKYSPILT